jgi:hypothetical protein
VKIEERAPPAKEAAAIAKRAGGGDVPSYAGLAKWFGGPAARVAASAKSATYRFVGLPAGTIKIASHDASADTVAEAVVNSGGMAPFVERVRITINAPFRIMLVAKIENMTATTSFRLMPDGRPVIAESTTNLNGSMLGKSGAFKSRSVYTDIQPLR